MSIRVLYLNCGSQSYHLTRLEGGMDASQMKQQVSTIRPECCREGSRSEGKGEDLEGHNKGETSVPGRVERWDPWEGGWDWPMRGGLAHLIQ